MFCLFWLNFVVIFPIYISYGEWKYASTSGLVTATHYDLDKHGLEKKIEEVGKKISNNNGLVKTTYYKTKITKIENKIPSVTGLVTTAALNTKATDWKWTKEKRGCSLGTKGLYFKSCC